MVIVLIGARRLRSVPGVQRLLALGMAHGVRMICTDDEPADLPVECRAVVELGRTEAASSGAAATVTFPSGQRLTVAPDLPGGRWAEQFARAVAPLRDSTPTAMGGLPSSARLLDLLGDDATRSEALANRWAGSAGSTVALLGVTDGGPYLLDLARDGPHVLVGGTTGAGKSELLQTLIASLALANRPDELGFVLVDYKGGAAFAECARLPHSLGLVTDLDQHLADRALTSLTAELRRRESILRTAGATDLDDLAKRTGPHGSPLARLVLVIDEFRMIAEELPGFLDGIVKIAALGRSLGVHLVLATQRPAGIVSADIAANVNLRIALRVRDQADSEDVVEARDAAWISPSTPGRALARSGSGPLVSFQTARVGGTGTARSTGCTARVVDLMRLADPAPAVPESAGESDHSDLSLIVGAAQAAARALKLPAGRRPWLAPLPELVTLDQLAARRDDWRAPYAVVDRPADQAQETLGWDLANDGHLAFVGTMRSGRSSALRSLAGSIARSFAPDEVHLHAIDGGSGALLALARLPHAGVVCGDRETARAVRLLDRLVAEVARRRGVFAAHGFSSLSEQHRATSGADRLPYLVLMIDGWEAAGAAWDGVDHGRPHELLAQLMRDGVAVGLRVAVTGDRGLLLSRTASLVADKVILRMTDPTDLVLAGISLSAVPQRLPPGRGVRVADSLEVQIALLDPDPSGAAQVAAIERIADHAGQSDVGAGPAPRPLRIEPLPTRVVSADLTLPAAPIGWALVGVGGDAGEPAGLQVAGGAALVAGPRGSGRSTLLATMASWLGRHGCPVVGLAPGRSPLGQLRGAPGVVRVLDGRDPAEVAAVLDAHPGSVVVADDVETLFDTESEDVVLRWFKQTRAETRGLLVAGATAELDALFRGLSVVARRPGQGVLLSPSSRADGEMLGVQLGPHLSDEAAHPGRGLLVADGVITPVQAALPSYD